MTSRPAGGRHVLVHGREFIVAKALNLAGRIANHEFRIAYRVRSQ
jgi:hypothetical protein